MSGYTTGPWLSQLPECMWVACMLLVSGHPATSGAVQYLKPTARLLPEPLPEPVTLGAAKDLRTPLPSILLRDYDSTKLF
jgi:hypothetical protein